MEHLRPVAKHHPETSRTSPRAPLKGPGGRGSKPGRNTFVIKVEPCGACGRICFALAVANLTIKADPEPLEASPAVTALLNGRALYRVTYLGGKPYRLSGASPDVLAALRTEPGERPMVVQEHRCSPADVSAVRTAVQRPEVPTGPKAPSSPPAAPSGPFSGPLTTPSGVTGAGLPRSEPQEGVQAPVSRPNTPSPVPGATRGSARPSGGRTRPRCDGCGQPCADGTYASVAVGELTVWAQHVQECPA